MALSEEQKKLLEAIDLKINKIQQKKQSKSVLLKNLPKVTQSVLRSQRMPEGFNSKTASEIKGVLETVGEKTSGTGFLAGLVNKEAGKAIQWVTGSTEAAKKAVDISNVILNRSEVPGGGTLGNKYKVVNIGSTYYLQDKQTKDFYLFNNVKGNRPIASAVIDFAELTGAVVGGVGGAIVGATGVVGAGVGAGATIPAGIAAGSTAGGAIGAGAAQLLREGVESNYQGLKPISGTANVAGEAGRALIEDGVLGVTLKTAGLAGRLVGKIGSTAGDLVKLIPGSSTLGQKLNTVVKTSGEFVNKKTSGVTKPLQEVGKRLQDTTKKVSDSIMNSDWAKKVGDNPTANAFNDYVSKVEQTDFGSFLLGVDKKVLDRAYLDIEDLDNFTAVSPKTMSNNIIIKTTTEKLNQLRELAKTQQVSFTAARESSEQAGNVFYDKYSVLRGQKIQNALDAYNKTASLELQQQAAGSPVAFENIEKAKDVVERQARQVGQELDNRINTIKVDAKKSGFEFNEDLINKETQLVASKYDSDIGNITREGNKQLEVKRTANQSLEQLQVNHQRQLQEFQSGLDKNLADNSQAIGKDLRDSLYDRWGKQAQEERTLYQGASKQAKEESKTVFDLQDDVSKIYDRLSEAGFDSNDISQIGKNLKGYSTPADLLAFKQDLDNFLSRPPGLPGSLTKGQYAALAEVRGNLVSDPDSIFTRYKAKSPAINDYVTASAQRIERNDFLQPREFAALVGTNINDKTGKVARGLNYAQDTYDNFVDIASRDTEVADRTIKYLAQGDSEKATKLTNDIKKNYIGSVYRGNGKNALATENAIDKNVLNFGKEFETDNLTGVMGDLKNLGDFELVKVPTKVSEIPGYADEFVNLNSEIKIRKANQMKDSALFKLEKKKQQDLFKKGQLEDSTISTLNQQKNKLSKPMDIEEVRKAVFSADEGLPTIEKAGLPSMEELKKIKEKNPQELTTLLGDLGYDLEARTSFINTLEAPDAIAGQLTKTEKGISKLDTELDTVIKAKNDTLTKQRLAGGAAGLGGAGIYNLQDLGNEKKRDNRIMSLASVPFLGAAGYYAPKLLNQLGETASKSGMNLAGAASDVAIDPATRYINEAAQQMSRGNQPNARAEDVQQALGEGNSFSVDPNKLQGLDPSVLESVRKKQSLSLADLLGSY